ncbi:hypothetical protein F443_10704 [Phytophthora nicotianae P1569]|uniref:Uncharacterized protein n=1 Tax=Phytophthora nicotianae P1569 TaxID=1317065 RepID=V9F1G3_PHYNI|nr:hypothetical protein F443_10704 [Phytophthora nicotianae P1569]
MDDSSHTYARYFYRYYTRFDEVPLSGLPASTVEKIMEIRLFKWLDNSLTPTEIVSDIIGVEL